MNDTMVLNLQLRDNSSDEINTGSLPYPPRNPDLRSVDLIGRRVVEPDDPALAIRDPSRKHERTGRIENNVASLALGRAGRDCAGDGRAARQAPAGHWRFHPRLKVEGRWIVALSV